MMHSIRGLVAAVCGLLVFAAGIARAQSAWQQPAQALADRIAEALGPGQARLVIHNISSISTDEIPAIRALLEQDLKARGVEAAGAESANVIRVTLSENVRERLWVAEILDGSQVRVTMVHVDPAAPQLRVQRESMLLRVERVISNSELSGGVGLDSDDPVLALRELPDGLVVLRQEEIAVFDKTTADWKLKKAFPIEAKQFLVQDPRGLLVAGSDADSFVAYLPGTECAGSIVQPVGASAGQGEWSVRCHASDDPWPIGESNTAQGANLLKAFYNARRNYFTGVLTPGMGVDLEPFYTAALLPQPDGAGLLLNEIDGNVQLVKGGSAKNVAGSRDWGSDFAVLASGCGAGTQVIVSSSGEAPADSLRAYELPSLEAVAASAPSAMDGTVMALMSAPDGKSVLAVVRHSGLPGQADTFEGDRVTATCN